MSYDDLPEESRTVLRAVALPEEPTLRAADLAAVLGTDVGYADVAVGRLVKMRLVEGFVPEVQPHMTGPAGQAFIRTRDETRMQPPTQP